MKMSTENNDIELKLELDIVLSKDVSVLEALPEDYLNELRTKLSKIESEQPHFLQNLSQEGKELFLKYIILPDDIGIWRSRLQTGEERKASEESELKRKTSEEETRKKQEDVTHNLLLQRKLEQERERADKEARDRADIEAQEKARADAVTRAAQNAARAAQKIADKLALARRYGF